MAVTSFSPRFVKAALTFKLDGAVFQPGTHLINSTGLEGIFWDKFDPLVHVGKKVLVSAKVVSPTPWEFNCEAFVAAEQSDGKPSASLGLTFVLPPDIRAKLDATVQAEGVLPEYVRKFPRIHFMERVKVFPARSIIRYYYNQEDIAVVCDIENVSPSGFLVHTDDARTQSLTPGETVRLQVSPRGGWLRVIHTNAVVKRINHTVDPATGNVRRYFGLLVTTMSGDSKITFTDLLRQIVIQAKG